MTPRLREGQARAATANGYVDAAVLARARELMPLVRRELGVRQGEGHERVRAVAIDRAKGELS